MRTVRPSRPSLHPRGFTLIELVLAIALGAMLLAAASGFMFMIGSAWERVEKGPLLDEHAIGVSNFLQYAIDNNLPEETNLDPAGSDVDDEQVEQAQDSPVVSSLKVAARPGDISLEPNNLRWRMSGEFPLFHAEDISLSELDAYLVFEDGEGLLLEWQTKDMKTEDEDDVRRTLLSPFVEEMVLHYYNKERDQWDEMDEFEEGEQGEKLLPGFIELRFVGPNEEKISRWLLLPETKLGIPGF